MDSTTTTIIHWNADGLSKHKLNLLKAVCAIRKPDVVLISETHLKAEDKLKIPHYFTYREDQQSPVGTAYRGLAVIVRRNVLHQQLPKTNLTSCYAMGVELSIGGTPHRIFAFYKPPGDQNRLALSDINNILDSTAPTIVAGDFNCKHTAWNSTRICPNGRRLFDDAERNNYEVLGPEVPTHYSYTATYCPDVLDLTITRGLATQPTLEVLDDHMVSDHQPVLVHITSQPSIRRFPPPRKRIDWEKFQEHLDGNTASRPVTTPADVDEMAEDITLCLRNGLEAASIESNRKRPQTHSIPNHNHFDDRLA